MRISETAAFLYTIPTFQNPSGRTMSAERRKRIVELAAFYNLRSSRTTRTASSATRASRSRRCSSSPARRSSTARRSRRRSRRGSASAGTSSPRSWRASSPRTRPSTYITPVLLNQAIAHEFIRRGNFEPNLERVNGPAQGPARRDAGRAREAPLGLHVDAPAGRLLHLARVPAGHAREGRAREGEGRHVRARRRLRRHAEHRTARLQLRLTRGDRAGRRADRRSRSSPQCWTTRRLRRDGGADGHRQRARDERRLLRWLERASGGPEGRARPLEDERAQAVAAEVAVLTGQRLGAHARVPRRVGRGRLAKADPRDSAAGVNALPQEKTRSFRPFHPAGKTASRLGLRERFQCLQRLLKTLHRHDA